MTICKYMQEDYKRILVVLQFWIYLYIVLCFTFFFFIFFSKKMSNNLPKLNPTFVALMSVLPVIDYNSVPIEVLRTNHASTTLSDDIPRPKVTVQRIKIPTCEDGYLIPADMHRPASAISNEVLPAMIFLYVVYFINYIFALKMWFTLLGQAAGFAYLLKVVILS